MNVSAMTRLFVLLTWKVALTVCTTIDWELVTTVQDVHFPDRLTTVDANTVHNCAEECFSRPACICMGYSSVQKKCQLYDMNLADFDTGLIPQGSTTIFRVTCLNKDYTYMRHLDTCMRIHNSVMNVSSASSLCQNESSQLFSIDPIKVAYLTKLYPNIGGTSYFVNGELLNATHMYTESGSSMISPIEALPWIHGEPNLANTCLSVTRDTATGSIGLKTTDCTSPSSFFCGHTTAI